MSSLIAMLRRTPLLPGLLLVALAFVCVRGAWIGDGLMGPLVVVARTLFAVSALIALRFGRVRGAVTLALLAIAFELVVVGDLLSPTSPDVARLAVGWGLPLWLLATAFCPAQAAGATGTLVRVVASGAALLGVVALAGDHGPAITAWAAEPLVDGLPNPGGGQLSAAGFIVALAALVVRLVRLRSAMDAGLVAATAAAWLAVMSPPGSVATGLYLAASAAALTLAIVETGYGLAYRDALTGLPSRRALSEELASLRGTYTLAMADVDHFKKFNDRHGHDVGDQVLRLVARELSKVGGGGRAFRYGGEEFTLLFKGMSPDQAQQHVEAVRQGIAAARLTLRGSDRPKRKRQGRAKRGAATTKKAASAQPRVSVTASFGVATGRARKEACSAVIKRADKALYKAKRAGRNRVVCA